MSEDIYLRGIKFILKKFKDEHLKKKFSMPDFIEKTGNYAAVLGLETDSNQLNLLNGYEKDKQSDPYKIFSTYKDAKGNDIFLAFEQSDDIKKDLAPLFALDQNYTDKKEEYEALLEAYSERIHKSKQVIKPKGLVDALDDLQKEAKEAFQSQQKAEKENLETALKGGGAFDRHLKDALKISDDALPNAKSNMLKALEQKHQSEQKAFNDSLDQQKNNLMKSANQAYYEVYFKLVHKLYDEGDQDQVNMSIGQTDENKKDKKISTGNLNEMELKTVSGRKITHDQLKDVDVIQFRIGIDPREWGDNRKSIRSLVLLQLAKGHDSIKLDIDGFSNDKKAKEKARQCAEAALELGYPPEKVQININGQKQDLQELLGPHYRRFADAHKQAAPVKHGDDGANLKKDLAKVRQELKAAALAAAADAAPDQQSRSDASRTTPS